MLPAKQQFKSLQRHATAFCFLQNSKQLSILLNKNLRGLNLLAQNPKYQTFSIPKKSGGERQIENPTPPLKNVQIGLNRYLQAVYYFHKTPCAYGFVANAKGDKNPRHILTNARCHLYKPYLLNIDLKSFFNNISDVQIFDVFKGKPFEFGDKLADLLTQLTCYNGHLPMGTPTSPVLSNFATRQLDIALLHLAAKNNWYYTRYADDMSFSTYKESFTDEHIAAIRQVIEEHHFIINEDKVKNYGIEDMKVVTGLILGKSSVELPENYILELEKELDRLKGILEIQNLQGEISTHWVDKFKEQIKGKLNFVGYVMGRQTDIYKKIQGDYTRAIHPPDDDFGMMSWRRFPYDM